MDGKKILIADDDSEIREVLRLLLSGEGYQIIEATNGTEVLKLLDDTVDLGIPPVQKYEKCLLFRYCFLRLNPRTPTRP